MKVFLRRVERWLWCSSVGLVVGVSFLLSPVDSLKAQVPPGNGLAAQPDHSIPAHVPGEVIVRFQSWASDSQIEGALGAALLEPKRHIQTAPMREAGDIGLTHALTHMPVEQAVKLLSRHPAVAYAEPNYIYTHQATANDSYVTNGALWGMYGESSAPANAFGSQAAESWKAGYTGSRTVYVGVIDEGIQTNHTDLAGNLWVNPYDKADGVDNDGNGYVDDVNGWNFANENNRVYSGSEDDHGTHVAGTIGAVGGNARGVAGVNWSVSMISAKFLTGNGGTSLDAIQAIDYFIDLKKRHGLNIVALNNSYGGTGYSRSFHEAIIRAANAGILFICAAGNDGNNNDATAYYPAGYTTTRGTSTLAPASYEAVITVAAIDKNGQLASFSNYGATSVDLGAPGVSICSTTPGNTYKYYSGTSMATPHVAGAVALYASTHPEATASHIRAALLENTIPTASLSGRTTTGGRLNLSASVVAPTGTPPVSEPATEVAWVTGFTPGTLRNDVGGWRGNRFKVGSNQLSVRKLGRVFVSGNAQNHELRLIRATDKAVVASTTWTPAGGVNGRIKYVSLASPATLSPNTEYYLVSKESVGGDRYYSFNTSVSTTTHASISSALFSTDGKTWQVPSTGGGSLSYGPLGLSFVVQ